MIRSGDTIHNPVTGERITFHQTSADTNGEAVVIECTVQPHGFVAAAHVHPFQTERFAVVDGRLGMKVGREKLVLEAVNTRVDHPGALTDRTADAVTVARGVGSPSFGILYDLYHSIVEGEDPATELENAAGLVDYVQIADAPGRGEPGSGSVDWAAQLQVLRASGYDGPIGLEYFPTVRSEESVKLIRDVAATA